MWRRVMDDTRYYILEKAELKEKLEDKDFMLQVVKIYCKGLTAKAKLLERGVEVEVLEDILDEDEKINDKFSDIVDRVTEQRYYRNAQIGIAEFTKLLLKNTEDPAAVKMCKEAIAALDSIKKSCHYKGTASKRKDFDEFREAMKALGV